MDNRFSTDSRSVFWIGGVLSGLFWALVLAGPAGAEPPEPGALQTAVAMEKLLIAAIERCEKSVVAVARVKQPEDEGAFLPLQAAADPTSPDFIPNHFGAGVVIDADGLILTNYHVIGRVGASEPAEADPPETVGWDYYVWSQRRPFQARVLAADPWYDLAVLKVDTSGLTPMPLGDGRQVRKGQIVIALGNPHAIARDGEVSASWGIVANLLRRAPPVPQRSTDPRGRETLHHYGTLIQTDARLNLGFSGGALINLRGEMIGLTTSYAANVGDPQPAGFAIPVDESFRRIVDALKEGRKPDYGFLGVAPESLAVESRQNGYHGARISRVLRATPAARAGLQTGDVITHINGRAVYDDDDLIRLIGSLSPESVARLTVVRGDLARNQTRLVQSEVELSKKHVRTLRPAYGTSPGKTWRGMQVDYATAAPDFEELVHRLDREGCVYVGEVDRDSPAWRAGIRPGMLVSRVQRQQIATPTEFYEAVAGRSGDVRLQINIGPEETAERVVAP